MRVGRYSVPMQRKSNKEKVIELFRPNAEGESDWVSVKAFVAVGLNWSKNGNARHGVFFGVGDFKWEKQSDGSDGPGTSHLRLAGWNNQEIFRQTITTRVKKALEPQTLCNISLLPIPAQLREIDHRYGNKTHPDYVNLYDSATQQPKDFQVIFSVLNSQKREICKQCCANNRRPSHPELGFVEGTEIPAETFPCSGCYLAEPEKYRRI